MQNEKNEKKNTKNEEEPKNEVRKVNSLSEEQEITYCLTKEMAFEHLKEADVTKSMQMLNKWCRDGDIDALRIGTGDPKNRGIRISKNSLEAFIEKRTVNVEELLKRIAELEVQNNNLEEKNNDLEKQVKELKDKGFKMPKKVKLEEVLLLKQNSEMKFKFKRASYLVIFDENGEILCIKKNLRGKGQEDVTDTVDEEVKEKILSIRQEKLKQKQT